MNLLPDATPETKSGLFLQKISPILTTKPSLTQPPFEAFYPTQSTKTEMGKSLTGAILCGGVIGFFNPHPLLAWGLGIGLVIFSGYFAQQWHRRFISFSLSEGAIISHKGKTKAQKATIAWGELEALHLRFYPHGRKSRQGILILDLQKGKTKIRLDSALQDFPGVLYLAVQKARELGLAFEPTTEDNLKHLGL